MADATTKIRIQAEDKISGELQKITSNLEKMNQMSLSKLAISFDAVAIAASTVGKAINKVYSAGKELVNIYGIQQTAEVKLQSVLRATGNQYNTNIKVLKEYASSLQSVTTFGDEAILGAEQMLLATQSLTEDGFKRALALSADLATAMGSDITSAADTLAIALQNPEQGLSRLRRQGIQFTDEEKNLIKAIQDAGDVAGAQSAIMDKLESKYKGIAEDVAKTDTGKLQQIKNTLGDIKENLGGQLLDTISPALDRLYEKLQKIYKWTDKTNVIRDFKSDYQGGKDSQYLAENYSSDIIEQMLDFYNSKNVEGGMDFDLSILRRALWIQEHKASTPKASLSSLEPASAGTSGGASVLSGEAITQDYTSLFMRSTSFKVDELNKQIEQANLKLTTATEQEQTYLYESIDSLMKERDKLLESPKSRTWVDYLREGLTYAQDICSKVSNSLVDMWDSQADSVEKEYEAIKENGELTVEEEKEKQDQINKLRKKAFIADKANSIAQALIDGANAIQTIWAKWADNPVVAGILTATSTATTATQVGTIASQPYTPSYAQGAYNLPQDQFAQVHKGEMIIPRPFAEDIRSGNGLGGCTVNIYVQGNADEEVIFNAIERAQRTGYLPKWSYA